MPPGYNLAYHSLPDNNVYKSTTIPEAKSSILEYLKKVFNNANTTSTHFAPLARRSEPLINPATNSKVTTTVTNDRLVMAMIFLTAKHNYYSTFACFTRLILFLTLASH